MKKAEDDKILNEIISSLKNYNEGYIDGSWENFQKKRERRKKRKKIIALFTGGIAALFLLCIIIHTALHYDEKTGSQPTLRTEIEKGYQEEEKSENNAPEELSIDSVLSNTIRTTPFVKEICSRENLKTDKNDSTSLVSRNQPSSDKLHLYEENSELTVPADSNKISDRSFRDTVFTKTSDKIINKTPAVKSSRKKFSFGVVVKESMNSTPSSSNVSFALGIVNEVKLSHKLFVSTGIILDRYNLNYKQDRVYSEDDPISVNAELLCLDIPLNLKMKLAEMKQSDVFISGGISTLTFIKERYSQNYVSANPTEMTVSFRNINFAGQINLSGGWQYRISDKMYITIESYVKIPLYKLAEEDLHFYQSGISLKISR